jgi:hypothetical protein
VIAQVIGKSDSGKFQRLAVAAAMARARWVAEAVSMTDVGAAISRRADRAPGHAAHRL